MSAVPAYPIRNAAMRPITKIKLFRVRLGIIGLALYWVTIFVGTHLPAGPKVAAKVDDKIVHFLAYFGLAVFLCYVTTSAASWRRFGIVALVAMAYGAIDELTQLLVPSRTASFLDYAADLGGIFSAILLYWVAGHLFRRQRANRLASW